MGLTTQERQGTVYFTGREVEHIATYGMFTLFVVGTPSAEEILQIASAGGVKQVYFGTSQSFNPKSQEEWETWSVCIKSCLDAGYWVTLDFDVKYAEDIHEQGWCEFRRFTPMISVKLPYIGLFNYNTTLKIDDRTWGATNPGVWTHHLHSLMKQEVYTDWSQYEDDSPL